MLSDFITGLSPRPRRKPLDRFAQIRRHAKHDRRIASHWPRASPLRGFLMPWRLKNHLSGLRGEFRVKICRRLFLSIIF